MPLSGYPLCIRTVNRISQLLQMARYLRFENSEQFGQEFPVVVHAVHQLFDIQNWSQVHPSTILKPAGAKLDLAARSEMA